MLRIVLVTLALILAPGAAASGAEEPPFPVPDVKEWTLDNGLAVAYLGVHDAPVVAVQVWYHVGSKDEPTGQRGAAHMFEHMMFKGSKRVPPERHARSIAGVGGVYNAFTREDVTGYQQTIPRQQLDYAVALEAERMRGLLFRKEMVDTEREVVKEELRQRIESSPVAKAFVRFREIAFTAHPYRFLPSGTKEDLDRLKPSDLKAFYDRYYQPNNAVLIVVGDVSEDEVKAAAQKHFGPIARGPAVSRVATPEPRQTQQRKETAPAAQLGVIIGGYKTPPAKSDDTYPLQVLSAILSGGESSRLMRRVVRKDGVGVGAGGQVWAFEDPGLFMVFGVYLQEAQAEKLEAAMLDEIARLGREKVSEQELLKARNQLTSTFVFGLENVDGLAEQIGSSRLLRGDAKAWIGDYARYQAVTADDVQRVARQYLIAENLTLVVIPPQQQPGGK